MKLVSLILLLATTQLTLSLQCAKGKFVNKYEPSVCSKCPQGCSECSYSFFACNENDCANCSACESGYDLKQNDFTNTWDCQKKSGPWVIIGVIIGSLAVIVGIIFCVFYCCCRKNDEDGDSNRERTPPYNEM